MKVRCYGAAGRVTGSCHLVQCGDTRILLDCGLIQGSRSAEALNGSPFPFDPAEIDAVVLSHAHIDHSGRLPLLARRGFDGVIHAHDATEHLCDIMLRDAAFIQEQDAARARRSLGNANRTDAAPLYSIEDAEEALALFRSWAYNETFDVAPGIRARFQDAGHILGSCIVELWLTEGSDTRKLVFSGDLGHAEAPVLRDPARLREADLVLLESTYGDRDHRPWAETVAEVEEIAAVTRRAKGNILIPAFAVGRSQLLLYWLARNFETAGLADWQIFLDSPLAISATELYEKHVQLLDKEARELWEHTSIESSLPNLRFTRSAEESMELNHKASGAIIIAGSGMCTGGRIRHHLRHNISRSESHVIIVGYQAQGTPGRALVDGARTLRMFGSDYAVNATVHTIGGLSAHAGQRGLVDWYDSFAGRPPVVLVHGEPDAQAELQRVIQDELMAPVHIAVEGDAYDLRKPVPFET